MTSNCRVRTILVIVCVAKVASGQPQSVQQAESNTHEVKDEIKNKTLLVNEEKQTNGLRSNNTKKETAATRDQAGKTYNTWPYSDNSNVTTEWIRNISKCTTPIDMPIQVFVHEFYTACTLCHYAGESFNTTVCLLNYPLNLTDTLSHLDLEGIIALRLVVNNLGKGEIHLFSFMIRVCINCRLVDCQYYLILYSSHIHNASDILILI